MKKTLKLFSAMVVAISLVFSLSTVTFAADEHMYNDETVVQPMAYPCPVCNIGTLFMHNAYGQWVIEKITTCNEHSYCALVTERRGVTTTYSCSRCPYSYIYQWIQYNTYHHPV